MWAIAVAGATVMGGALGTVLGWTVGIRACARSSNCLLHQRHKVEDWTGEITKKMQDRLAKRERRRASECKDTRDDWPSVPDAPSDAT